MSTETLLPPEAYQWHRKPRSHRGPCPVCGCPSEGFKFAALGEHRAVAPDERKAATWLRRVPDPTRPRKYRYEPVKPAPGHHFGMMEKTRNHIVKAARLEAMGRPQARIADAMKVDVSTLREWKTRYATFWAEAAREARQQVVDTVREVAGSDGVLQDVQTFLALARAATTWCEVKGEPLFPKRDAMTLPEFFEEYYLRNCLADATKGTIYFYRLILRRWVYVTGDPALRDIDGRLLTLFRDALIEAQGEKPGSKMSLVTVRGYLRRIQTLLDKAGPPGTRNRDAAGILEKVPWIRPPRAIPPEPKIVPLEHLETVYRACDRMVSPMIEGVATVDWWRAILAVAYNTGLRRKNIFALEWSQVDIGRRLLTIPAAGMKAKRLLIVPLNATAIEHLERIRAPGRKKVFAIDYCQSWFNVAMRRLQYDAGLHCKHHFGLHDLRRTFATELYRRHPEAARLLLGHAVLDTTLRHYIEGERILTGCVDELPQPAAFRGNSNGQ